MEFELTRPALCCSRVDSIRGLTRLTRLSQLYNGTHLTERIEFELTRPALCCSRVDSIMGLLKMLSSLPLPSQRGRLSASKQSSASRVCHLFQGWARTFVRKKLIFKSVFVPTLLGGDYCSLYIVCMLEVYYVWERASVSRRMSNFWKTEQENSLFKRYERPVTICLTLKKNKNLFMHFLSRYYFVRIAHLHLWTVTQNWEIFL